MDGGVLEIEWTETGRVLMTGPVATSFRGRSNCRVMSVEIVTFGCRLNAFESEVIRGHAAGLRDTVVVNTCAVTAEAERQARQAIRRVARDRPGAAIVVTGCAAQIAPDRWAAMPGVTRVLGNEEKLRAESWVRGAPGAVGDIWLARTHKPASVTGFAGRARAFIEVQQGCDHRCTFCIIPQGRGPSRRVPIGGGRRPGAGPGRGGYQRGRADRGRPRQLRAGLPGAPTSARCARLLAGAGTAAAAPLLARPGGDRSRAVARCSPRSRG